MSNVAYNIAIIEDNIDIRRTLSEYFEHSERISCVLAVDSVEKFFKFHRDFLEIKLILLDVMLYNQSSILSIPHILQREPDAEIIMFTVFDDTATLFQALTYGATGYLLKDISLETLESSLLMVLDGSGALISPSMVKKIIQHFRPSGQALPDNEKELSQKEYTVVGLLNEGRSYEEIALRLGMTINGVRYYVKNIYKKLNISSRGALLRISPKKE